MATTSDYCDAIRGLCHSTRNQSLLLAATGGCCVIAAAATSSPETRAVEARAAVSLASSTPCSPGTSGLRFDAFSPRLLRFSCCLRETVAHDTLCTCVRVCVSRFFDSAHVRMSKENLSLTRSAHRGREPSQKRTSLGRLSSHSGRGRRRKLPSTPRGLGYPACVTLVCTLLQCAALT